MRSGRRGREGQQEARDAGVPGDFITKIRHLILFISPMKYKRSHVADQS